MDFAAVAKRENKEVVLKTVQIEGLALLKIVQHCNEVYPQLGTGQLLGLDVGQTLEVTDCYPFPTGAIEDSEEEAATNYQMEMMRLLREVNVDNNTVGWYQSTTMGTAFQTVELIETFSNYSENIRKCVCLVYEPARSTRGNLALKAIRLKDSFLDLYKQQKLTSKELREAGISFKEMFVEIPIKVHNSGLVQAAMAELRPPTLASPADFDRLGLSTVPMMEKNIRAVLDCVDDIIGEQQKVSTYHRNAARQAQLQAGWLQKRKAENAARRAAGEEPLPEEDPTQFRPIPEPSLLDNYLVTSQMASYCDELNQLSSQALQKLYLMQGLQQNLLPRAE